MSTRSLEITDINTGNQPCVFCGQGMAIPVAASVNATRSLLHREGIWAETHEKTRVGFKFVYFDCALFVCFLQRGNGPCVLLLLFFLLYGFRAAFQRCSLDPSLGSHWEKNLHRFPMTRGARTDLRVCVGWVGPHLQCRPGRREVTLFVLPSAPLPVSSQQRGTFFTAAEAGWAGYPLPAPEVPLWAPETMMNGPVGQPYKTGETNIPHSGETSPRTYIIWDKWDGQWAISLGIYELYSLL